MPKSPPASVRGFTLMELMLALAILAAAAGLALPRISGSIERMEMKAAARELLSTMRLARAKAIAGHEQTKVEFDLAAHTFHVSGAGRKRDLPEAAKIDLFTTAEQVWGEDRGSILFYPDGSSSGGGVKISMGNVEYQVSVDWLTGRAAIE